ncbi:hypothetical protein GCM10027422_47470 [Hymenobacter arcticus]
MSIPFMTKHLCFYVFFLAFYSCQSQKNISYVNPNKLLQGYHGATTQHELFKAKAQSWQKRVDSLSTELQAVSKARASS